MKFLKGKKTYILAIAGGVIFALARVGFIPADLEVQIYIVLGIGGMAALRNAIK